MKTAWCVTLRQRVCCHYCSTSSTAWKIRLNADIKSGFSIKDGMFRHNMLQTSGYVVYDCLPGTA
uniref:Uncharacterized protein n=1 Tax=Babesia bovis TaxID=5865 RepID=S6B6N2_BABBO|nr:hypothetical protein [Babesia bovis]